MAASPLRNLIVSLQDRGDYAWLSIGATLFSGASAAQARLACIPTDLLANPWGDGRERSMTIPFASDLEDGWLLVWMTRPTSRRPNEFEQRARDYLRAKKHQLSLPREVVFLYDEGTIELIDVIYDDHVCELEPACRESWPSLSPLTTSTSFRTRTERNGPAPRPPVTGRRTPGRSGGRFHAMAAA
jgi:hypothetical protein